LRRNAAGKRRDANEGAIIDTLRAVGCSVQQLSGADMPDLLVGYRGENFLIEVKTLKGKLRERQQAWHRAWQGIVHIVREPVEILRLLGLEGIVEVKEWTQSK
jgi:hypothetical protein